MEKNPTITRYKNATVARWQNTRIIIQDATDADGVFISFSRTHSPSETAEIRERPSAQSKSSQRKRDTHIKISAEAMEYLMTAYRHHRSGNAITTYS